MRTIGAENKDTPKASGTPALRDLEWAAGFLEGEGTFHHNSSTQVTGASQASKEPLLKLQNIFGGSINKRKSLPSRFSQKDIFVWSTSGSRARGVMMTLYPLLSERRRQQIKEALNA